MLKAGRDVLGDEANTMSNNVIQNLGKEKLLVDLGSAHLASNLSGTAFEIASEQLVKRGTAAFVRTLIHNLDEHDVWNDGLLDAIDTMWHKTSRATVKEATQWGGKDVAIRLAKHIGAVRSGSVAEALIASLIWRSVSASIK